MKGSSTESDVALPTIQPLIIQEALKKFWKTLSPPVLKRSVGRVEALMLVREDRRDLLEEEEKKDPKESRDRLAQVESEELWDYQVKVENKELWDHRA